MANLIGRMREILSKQIDKDAEPSREDVHILKHNLDLNASSPEDIKDYFGFSKKAF